MTRPRVSGFRIQRLMTVGETSTLWLAVDEETGQENVLKVSKEPLRASLEALDVLLFSLVTVSEHPSLVRVHGGGVSDDDHPFMTLEPCLQATLRERIQNQEVPLDEALPTMIGLASAVQHMHRAGALHGAISPEHVLIRASGEAALAGFSFPGVERSGRLAPEVLRGEEPDERSDVFGLGATMWELVGAGSLPVKLQTLLAAAVADDPRHRISSVKEFLTGLKALEQRLGLPETVMPDPATSPPRLASPLRAAVDPDAETRLKVVNPDTITRLRRSDTWEESSLGAETRLRDSPRLSAGGPDPLSLPEHPVSAGRGRHAFDPGDTVLPAALYKPRALPVDDPVLGPAPAPTQFTHSTAPSRPVTLTPRPSTSTRRVTLLLACAGAMIIAGSGWALLALLR